MAANIDIINRALAKLGQARLSSLADRNSIADLAGSLFDIVRDDEIAAHRWHFAKARVRLAAEAEKPAFGWAFQYVLPGDCLRVLLAGPWPQPVMGDYVGGDTQSYVIEGRKILSRLGPALDLSYLRRVEEAALFPPEFVEVLACKLAVEMCETLTGSASKRDLAWKEYEQAVRRARRVNAIQLPPQFVQDDSWLLAHQLGVL